MPGNPSAGKTGRVIVAMIALALTTTHFALAAQNDANSGADAANTADKAVKLGNFGLYNAAFEPSETRDWYRVKVAGQSEPTCVSVAVSSSMATAVQLVSVTTGSATREVKASISPGNGGVVGIAANSFRGAFLKAESGVSNLNSLQSYSFDLRSVKHSAAPSGDAGTGDDVGSDFGSAHGLAGPCTAGSLVPAEGDTKDMYRIAGSAGDRVLVSLADSTGTLQAKIRTPTGDLLASVAAGSLHTFTMATTGDYFVSVTDSSTSPTNANYMLGICSVDCGPPEDPCQPMCVDILATEG